MSTPTLTTPHTRTEYLPVALTIGVYFVVVLKTAWLCDDAYITFRTVDNFVGGYGLTWNVVERVQTYTHPLWMLLLSAAYAITHEIEFVSMLLGAAISVLAVSLYAARLAGSALVALVGAAILMGSKAFTDYSTSGLENPLTHLLLVAFLLVYLARPLERRSLLWLALLAGLLTLNRMDTILLVLPALCVAWFQRRSPRSLGIVLLGFTPFIAWGAFSLIYYGFLFPNTAYAKLNNGLPAVELMRQGLLYLLETVKLDPLTAVVLLTGLVAPLVTRQRRHIPLAVGMLLYLFYVVRVGGDFMLGRFLSPPLLIGTVLLTRVPVSTRVGMPILVMVGVLAVLPARSPLKSGEGYSRFPGYPVEDNHWICDERAFYYSSTGLLPATHQPQYPDNWLATRGRVARAEHAPIVTDQRIGFLGFFAGPEVYVLDEMALSDPLLARLKPIPRKNWRIGHFQRAIPEGYLETVRTGQNVIADPELAAYYDKITRVTRGPLWSRARWKAILRMNLGLEPAPPQNEAGKPQR